MVVQKATGEFHACTVFLENLKYYLIFVLHTPLFMNGKEFANLHAGELLDPILK